MGGGWECSGGGASEQGHRVPGIPQDAAALPQVQGPVRYVVVRVLVCFICSVLLHGVGSTPAGSHYPC